MNRNPTMQMYHKPSAINPNIQYYVCYDKSVERYLVVEHTDLYTKDLQEYSCEVIEECVTLLEAMRVFNRLV